MCVTSKLYRKFKIEKVVEEKEERRKKPDVKGGCLLRINSLSKP